MDNKTLNDKIAAADSQLRDMENEGQQYQDKIINLQQQLEFMGANSGDPNALKKFEHLAQLKERAEKRVEELLGDCNTYSNLIEDLKAENKTLRTMYNVPTNFGIEIDQIKLQDKETIDDYKRLIKELQNDNYSLEAERAKLKEKIKHQSMLYKATDPTERFRGLTQDQIQMLDEYVLRLRTGEVEDPTEYNKIKKENIELKAKLDQIYHGGLGGGFDMFNKQIENLQEKIKGQPQFIGGQDPQKQLADLIKGN